MGIWQISWMQWLLVAFVATHITIIGVTVYLHRSQAHRALDLNPVVCHFFRLWLWLTTGMSTREWVAVHRKHHAHVETRDDPHSPVIYGIWRVLFNGVGLYRKAAEVPAMVEKYGAGTPDDWLERNLYTLKNSGVISMLVIDFILFGWGKGALMWGVQMLWIPLLAAGVINGVGHHLGYRNYQPVDESKNIVPWGLLIGGEELHNNHHAFPRSAKFSARSFEFDLGYVYIKLLAYLGLAKVNYVLPNLSRKSVGGVKGILNARMGIYREFQKRVTTVSFKHNQELRAQLKGMKVDKLLLRPPQLLKDAEKKVLSLALSLDDQLDKVYELQVKLYKIFYENKGHDLITQVRQWCQEAKGSHQQALSEFATWIEEQFLQTMTER
jgi:stearoyl-CoA desaturase (Delta-9 desaturase)